MIEKFYRVRLDFEYPKNEDDEGFYLDRQAPVDNDLCAAAFEYEADIDIFSGNPACGPYVECEAGNSLQAGLLQSKLLTVLYEHDCKVGP